MLRYLLSGLFFGFVLVKSEVVSWFRIQEMFRFDAFHMYGIIGVAIVVAMVSIMLIKKKNITDLDGNPISIPPKDSSQVTRYIIGGITFGLGWALLGACPGPMFSLLGTGLLIMVVPIAAALLGTWAYGALRPKLPH
jgi:uncharacterized membrane protein YedE/YeeE